MIRIIGVVLVLIGVAGLHILWEDLAEVRSVAVAPDHTGKGIGRELVQQLEAEARELKLARVFALTYQDGFFGKLGYEKVAHDSLPQKVWMECVNCPKFPACDEFAMVKLV